MLSLDDLNLLSLCQQMCNIQTFNSYYRVPYRAKLFLGVVVYFLYIIYTQRKLKEYSVKQKQ